LAQNFPTKPLKIIAGNPGGGTDMMARLAAQGLTANLGQPAVVINRSGRQIPYIMEAARSTPDGYTLLSLGANQFWLTPFLQDNVPYDPVKDFLPVSLTASSPNMLVVHPSVQATNVRELIALARAKPGVLNYGAAGAGGSPHLAGEMFKAMSQTKIVAIQYKGAATAMTGLLGGEIQLMFPTVSTGMPAVKAGQLRALAVTTARPTPLAPGLPTVNESGVPGYESSTGYAVFVPAKTPANLIDALNRAIVRHLQAPDLKEKAFGAGMEIVASSPQDLAAAMKQDMVRMGKVIREAGIRGEN
jgi:tripartite-type tricarboxylate transporter receptor subunit TctC